MRRVRSSQRDPEYGLAVHLVILGVLLLFILLCLTGLIGGFDGSFDVGSIRPGAIEKFMSGAFVAFSAIGAAVGVTCFLAFSVRLVIVSRRKRSLGSAQR